MFFNARCNSKYVWIENDILWIKTNLLCQYFIRLFTNCDPSFERIGLTLFVKCHYYHSGTICLANKCLFNEPGFALFHGYGVHNTFSLHAF
jgi:hypothetical protein